MTLFYKEHYELIEMFERQFKEFRLDKEDKSMWPRGHVYQSGVTNDAFLAFRHGYAFGVAAERNRKEGT